MTTTSLKSMEYYGELVVVVPVYNEAKTLESAIQTLITTLETLDEISSYVVIVVESGSTDGSRSIAQSLGETYERVRVIFQSAPRGKGNAVREGIQHASGKYFLIYDADLEYSPSDIPKLLHPLVLNHADFVLGTRPGRFKVRNFRKQALMTFAFNLAHVFFAAILSILTMRRLRDPFTMYKVARFDHIQRLNLVANRFDFDWELVIKLARLGARFVEIPISYESRSYKDGKKVRLIRDPLTWLYGAFRFRFGRLFRAQ